MVLSAARDSDESHQEILSFMRSEAPCDLAVQTASQPHLPKLLMLVCLDNSHLSFTSPLRGYFFQEAFPDVPSPLQDWIKCSDVVLPHPLHLTYGSTSQLYGIRPFASLCHS